MNPTYIAPIAGVAGSGQSAVGWERQYFDGLAAKGSLSASARAEIVAALDKVFEHISAPSEVPEGHRVVGALVGAIQSGKTGVMIGLAARALDRGFRIVIVLAGLRDDLRTQTALRFTSDLLQRGDPVRAGPGESLFTHPEGPGYHGTMGDACWSLHHADDVNHDESFIAQLSRVLRRGRSALIVAKKNLVTLNHLQEAISHASRSVGAEKISVLVVDDECDEASVSGSSDAPTPDRIVDVWSEIPQYVAYAGLTATPAANLLQDTEAALFPADFVEVLRVPGAERSDVMVEEPDPDRRYTGGFTFYRYLESVDRDNFLLRPRMSDAEYEGEAGADYELEEALLAYFVSGAMRLAALDGRSFADASRLPKPHTMLAHTDVQVDSHWELCRRVVSITRRCGGTDGTVEENLRPVPPGRRLNPAHLRRWLADQPERWKAWYEDFRASRNTLLEVSADRKRSELPSWDEITSRLPEVFDNTKLRVINSDETSSDPPLSFGPSYEDGVIRAPTDVYSIVIGGNRLSRGLTIEGLCISYYTRRSALFLEDSTVQRERWFGYRGAHLEYCRLFTHPVLSTRLSRFHEHDEDLRRQLAWNIAHGRAPTDATFRFLQLRDSKPTAKLGRGVEGALEISGARAFLSRVQMGRDDQELIAARMNAHCAAQIASSLISEGERLENEGGDLTGYVRRDCPASDVAELLESLRFVFHNPDPTTGVQMNLRDFYRSPCPDLLTTPAALSPSDDPYLIAAYLRFWSHAHKICIESSAQNTFLDRDGVSAWSPSPPPSFNVVLRIGSLKPAKGSPFSHRLLNRSIAADGRLGSRWGGRGYGSDGDEWIDTKPPDGDQSAPRPQGAPGLALLHVISSEATGRNGDGAPYYFDRPTFGLIVPEGGPCVHFVLASPQKSGA